MSLSVEVLDYLNQNLPQEVVCQLIENGFDDDQSLAMVDRETLKEIKLEESTIDRVLEVIRDIFEKEEKRDYTIVESQEMGVFTEEKRYRKNITIKLILSSILTEVFKKPPTEANLPMLTHLHLNGKKLTHISCLEQCVNLKVLYLFDNQIEKIEGLENMDKLIQLSLYNNRIEKIEGLLGLKSLKRLYLEKNKIKTLEGLENCRQLEELNLNDQDISEEFTFDDYSIAAISFSLKTLDIQNSKVKNPRQLYFCENLEFLNLKNNFIEDFSDQVMPLLQTLNRLQTIDLTNNPVTLIPKYRDQVVLLTNSLSALDGKKINQQERNYIRTLVQRKQMQGSKGAQKKSGKGKQNFVIEGQNKVLHHQADLPVQERVYQDESSNDFYKNEDDCVENQPQYPQKVIYSNQSTGRILKKQSNNINSGKDFTAIGQSHVSTKIIPKPISKK